VNTTNTELLDRDKLKTLINDMSIKHAWLASEIRISERTLTRWINGDVTRVRISNLKKLAVALGCETNTLIARSETESYPSHVNRAILVNELHNDSLLYELLMSSKIKLAIALIKSTFHSRLPLSVLGDFHVKLGYASLIHRKFKSAIKQFDKAGLKARSAYDNQLIFSVNLGLAITHFFDDNYSECQSFLNLCEATLSFSGHEKAHFYCTSALFYIHSGQLEKAIDATDNCIEECSPDKTPIEKKLFLCTAMQLKGAIYLFLGKAEQAEKCCRESLEVAVVSGYSRCVNVSKAYLAAVLAYQGDTQSAVALCEMSIDKTDKKDISYPSLIAISLFVYRKLGDADRCLEKYTKLKSITREYSNTRVFGQYQMLVIEHAAGHSHLSAEYKLQLTKSLQKLGLTNWIEQLQIDQ
jgi:tetratricopeptide (TPR) repeat protein